MEIKFRELDQFFTKKEIAQNCWNNVLEYLADLNLLEKDCFFIEPSAGNGSFFNLLPPGRRIGIDLMPRANGIVQADFMQWKPPPEMLKYDKQHCVFVGNPPFGKGGFLASAFIHRAAMFADTIAFILPPGFVKNHWQNRLMIDLRIANETYLGRDCFEFPNKKITANVKFLTTYFQIYSRLAGKVRGNLHSENITSHLDFRMVYYYREPNEVWYDIKCKFDFAVVSRGYKQSDYTDIVFEIENCLPKKSYILFVCKNSEIAQRMIKIDYLKLANQYNLLIPGFAFIDVIKEYDELYKNQVSFLTKSLF